MTYQKSFLISLLVTLALVLSSCSKEEIVHLDCVKGLSTEFPLSETFYDTLRVDAEYIYHRSKVVFKNDGTFFIDHSELCYSHLEDRYCSLVETDTFNLQLSGFWGPHEQTITDRENKSNCGGLGNPFSSCDINFTYNELYGSAPFQIETSNLEYYNGRSGVMEYRVQCLPIQGFPPEPPYLFEKFLEIIIENDPFELRLFWNESIEE